MAHLIPTNDSYEDFWNISSIGAGIMDQSGENCYRSLSSIEVTLEEIRGAEHEAVFLENGNVILKSSRIHGGFGYWIRDISEINRLNQELSELGDVLNEENAMLGAENEMRAKRVRIEQQNKLYSSMAKQLSPQLALKESLEYVHLYGILAHGSYKGEVLLPRDWILLAYKVFEAVLETVIPGAKAVLVNLFTMDKYLVLRMEIDSLGMTLSLDNVYQEIEASHGNLDIEADKDSDTKYVSLSFLSGGERK